MKVKIRPLNKGELFCCSLSVAKQMFKDTNITLNFSYYGRNYGAFNNTFYASYLKNKVKGYVIAYMSMESRYDHPLLSFYVLKEKIFSSEMRKEFEERFLTEFLQLYDDRMADEEPRSISEFIIVELIDGKMILHRQLIK